MLWVAYHIFLIDLHHLKISTHCEVVVYSRIFYSLVHKKKRLLQWFILAFYSGIFCCYLTYERKIIMYQTRV